MCDLIQHAWRLFQLYLHLIRVEWHTEISPIIEWFAKLNVLVVTEILVQMLVLNFHLFLNLLCVPAYSVVIIANLLNLIGLLNHWFLIKLLHVCEIHIRNNHWLYLKIIGALRLVGCDDFTTYFSLFNLLRLLPLHLCHECSNIYFIINNP
jgi:hypothetical protein